MFFGFAFNNVALAKYSRGGLELKGKKHLRPLSFLSANKNEELVLRVISNENMELRYCSVDFLSHKSCCSVFVLITNW